MKNRLALIIILLMAGGALIVTVAFMLDRYGENSISVTSSPYRGTVYDPPLELTNFTLPASTGMNVSLSDLQGQWVLMFFGYTHCPDFCPMTLTEYRQVMEILEGDSAQLQVVFISVDGERDTPDILSDYMARFDPEFIGLSGDDATLTRLQSEFGLYYQRQEDTVRQGNYLVDHSTHSYLIDPQGRLRIAYAYDTDRHILAESIREMIRQS
ncbi:MAG: SCO family protein [Aggregatilineales bacterium]